LCETAAIFGGSSLSHRGGDAAGEIFLAEIEFLPLIIVVALVNLAVMLIARFALGIFYPLTFFISLFYPQ
jgi:hypothetical protein